MKLRFLNTYLIPTQKNIWGKIDKLNSEFFNNNEVNDIIALQEVYKWKVGLLSKLLLIPLSRQFPKQSVKLLYSSVAEGKYRISNIIGIIGVIIAIRRKKKYYYIGILTILIIQNWFFGYFDTTKYLKPGSEYKYIFRSQHNNYLNLNKKYMDGGLLFFSKYPFSNTKEIDYKEYYPDIENSFISAKVTIEEVEYTIINTHLTPTWKDFRDSGKSTHIYGKTRGNYKPGNEYFKSRKIRELQIKELVNFIKSQTNAIVVGDFNIDKFLDKEEYNNMVFMFRSAGFREILPKNLNKNTGLIDGGTHINKVDDPDFSRKYLDFAFTNISDDRKIQLLFDSKYIQGIDHKAATIEIDGNKSYKGFSQYNRNSCNKK